MKLLIIVSASLIASVATAQRGTPAVPPTIDGDVVAEGLETPWSMAFAPDGRMFITERVGRIRIFQNNTLQRDAWATLPVHASAQLSIESGLMGLAIDPKFATTHRVYVCYTQGDRANPINRVGVFTEVNGTGTNLTVLVDNIPAGRYHNGCRLAFGPDGMLYITTGDAAESRDGGGAAQSATSLAGKVLRINSDGTVPADNPYPRSPVWSLGHRNAQGMAFQPGTGRLYIIEQGTGDGGGNELNRIERGKNYGWPAVIGIATQAQFVNPLLVRPEAWCGATFVKGTRYSRLQGTLLASSLSAQRLLSVSFSADGSVNQTHVLIDKKWGRLRDVVEGPDGAVYVATSNRDGRGTPEANDDRIVRLREVKR